MYIVFLIPLNACISIKIYVMLPHVCKIQQVRMMIPNLAIKIVIVINAIFLNRLLADKFTCFKFLSNKT